MKSSLTGWSKISLNHFFIRDVLRPLPETILVFNQRVPKQQVAPKQCTKKFDADFSFTYRRITPERSGNKGGRGRGDGWPGDIMSVQVQRRTERIPRGTSTPDFQAHLPAVGRPPGYLIMHWGNLFPTGFHVASLLGRCVTVKQADERSNHPPSLRAGAFEWREPSNGCGKKGGVQLRCRATKVPSPDERATPSYCACSEATIRGAGWSLGSD